MELFLSLNKKKVKGNLSPPIKCKIYSAIPNGKYLIQPSKLMTIKLEEKAPDNHSNVKTDRKSVV